MIKLRSLWRGPRALSGDAGAVLPITALLLVILFVFAAFSVDLGSAWAERRKDQSAADAAAMAGALEYVKGTPSSATALQVVKDYAANSLGITDADWLFPACEDPDHYELIDPAIQCISLGQTDVDGAVLRVRLPDQEVSTSFARVIGKDTLFVSAAAEAQVDYQTIGNLRPFSLPSNPGEQECLGTPPDGWLVDDPEPIDPCAGPTAGNFGLLDSPFHGAPPPLDTISCADQVTNFADRTPLNIALGLDHPVVETPDLTDNTGTDDCGALSAPTYVPWILNSRTGFTFNTLSEGLIGDNQFGTDNEPGLLRQVGGLNPGGGSSPHQINLEDNSGERWVDNVGLWEYLDPTSTNDCDPALFTGLVGRELTLQMVDCLDDTPGPPSSRVFTVDLLSSPRFAVVPQLNYLKCDNPSDDSTCLNGNEWVHIIDFVPVYLQGTWYSCNPGPGLCEFQPDDYIAAGDFTPVHYPGEGTAEPITALGGAPNTLTAAGISAFVLDWGWLTPENAEEILGDSSPLKVRLYR